MKDGQAFFAGLWSEVHDLMTGEARPHAGDLATDTARWWIEPGPLPAELLAPYPAEEMTAWRVADDAKNSRIEPHPGMAELVAGTV